MQPSPEPPPIVVARTASMLKKRRKRNPFKLLVLAVALVWPFAIIASTTALFALAKQGARLQNDGNYYIHTEGIGWSKTSLGEFFVGSLVCGGAASTLLCGGVMGILWVAWWATEESGQ